MWLTGSEAAFWERKDFQRTFLWQLMAGTKRGGAWHYKTAVRYHPGMLGKRIVDLRILGKSLMWHLNRIE